MEDQPTLEEAAARARAAKITTNPALGPLGKHGAPLPPSPFDVGTVWYTSWGYDQTNIEFFEVVRELPKSIVLRRIKAMLDGHKLVPVTGEYQVDFHLEGNPHTPTWERDHERGYSEKLCRKPRPSKDGYLPESVRIDNVRFAWPYEGGGKYDTIAAGDPGH